MQLLRRLHNKLLCIKERLVLYFESAPNFENYTFEELVDAFIHIDDSLYEKRALAILTRLADLLNISVLDLEMENIVNTPTQSFIQKERFLEKPSAFIDETYTREGFEVKEKLIRLKLILNKPLKRDC